MNRCIELNKSTIASITHQGRDLVIFLDPALLHESDGVPGQAPGRTYTQALELRVSHAGLSVVLDKLPIAIEDGSLSVAASQHHNLVTLPLVHLGAVRFRCVTRAGERFSISGEGVAAVFKGERRSGLKNPGGPAGGCFFAVQGVKSADDRVSTSDE